MSNIISSYSTIHTVKKIHEMRDSATIDLKDNVSIDEIKTDIGLPTLVDDIIIKWKTSNSYLISIDGTVDNEGLTLDTEVTLTAIAIFRSLSETKTFLVTVLRDTRLEEALADLDIDLLENPSLQEITTDVSLPLTGLHESTVVWVSSNTDYISNSGEVLQRDADLDLDITLTATLTVPPDIEGDKEFEVKLLKDESLNWLIFEVDTEKTTGSVTNDDQFKLPMFSTGTYDYTVDWGDETSEDTITAWNQAEATHTYAEPGIYQIKCKGQYWAFGFQNSGDKTKLLDVSRWGVNVRLVNGIQFMSCTNLTGFTATDAPGLTGVTSFYRLLSGCTKFNSTIQHWNTSSITLFEECFTGCTSFNQPLADLDTSSATTMQSMFQGANKFNQTLNGWDTSNVLNMSSMFYGASIFKSSLSDWNVEKVTTMSNMFYNASIGGTGTTFSNLKTWKTSALTNTSSMFRGITLPDLDLTKSPGGGFYFDMSKVTNANDMFRGSYLGGTWPSDYRQINLTGQSFGTNCFVSRMFRNLSFTTASATLNLDSLDTSNIVNMDEMFYEFEKLNQLEHVTSVRSFDVSNVTSMKSMFRGTTNLTQSFNINLSAWDVSKVTDMESFASYRNITNMKPDWTTTALLSTSNFARQSVISSAALDGMEDWNVSKVTNFSYMFADVGESGQYIPDLSDWNVGTAALNLEQMFVNCRLPTAFNPSTWNTTNVSNMSFMFGANYGSSTDLKTLPSSFSVAGWTVFNLTQADSMFRYRILPSGFTIEDWALESINATTSMSNMFLGTTIETTPYNLMMTKWRNYPGTADDVIFHGGDSVATGSGLDKRNELISVKDWQITDGIDDDGEAPI